MNYSIDFYSFLYSANIDRSNHTDIGFHTHAVVKAKTHRNLSEDRLTDHDEDANIDIYK